MNKVKKLEIDISTYENKKIIYRLFSEFNLFVIYMLFLV